MWRRVAFLLCNFLTFVLAAAEDNDDGLDADPYLTFKPPFVRSLPVQLLLTGIVLALTTVLFIHLLFTGQYHWPLAPVNYALQLSGVTTLLVSLIATINVVLKVAYKESSRWPYMLSYIAVNVPPLEYLQEAEREWTTAERATWMVMDAATSVLIQVTHIQFLTLLYPSRLEGRLIFITLGPMAVVAAVMQLVPIQTNNHINLVASAIRNVCNATLSLLFTVALFVWGLLINREQAWRTDGGTAAFGAAALMLAVVSTALNFLYIPREEEYVWLPSLMWAVILWQSFLGWWWWVGAGSASNVQSRERVEQLMRKEAKKAQREKRRQEKMEQRKRARGSSAVGWKGLTGVFGTSLGRSPNSDENTRSQSQSEGEISDEPRQRPIGSWGTSTDANGETSTPRRRAYASSIESSSGLTSATLPQSVPGFIHRWYARLRVAHTTAARQQAAERIARIRELERSGNAPRHVGSGWGLGSFGLRLYRDQESMPTDSSTTHELRERRQVEVEDVDAEPRFRSDDQTKAEDAVATPQAERPPRSIWWWGPLQRWRLQDSTRY